MSPVLKKPSTMASGRFFTVEVPLDDGRALDAELAALTGSTSLSSSTTLRSKVGMMRPADVGSGEEDVADGGDDAVGFGQP